MSNQIKLVDGMIENGGRIPVVHLVSSLNVGGLEMVVLHLARNCNRDRFAIRVLCLQEKGKLAPAFEDIGIHVESLDCPELPKGRTLSRVARRLRQLKPRILHTHNMNPHFFGAVAACAVGVPVLIHTKHGRNYPDRRVAVLKNWFLSFLTDRVVTVSADAANVVRQIERVPAQKTAVIRNGIDISQFRSTDRRSKGSGKEAIHIGRLNISKDQATLLRAARLVADADCGFRLTIVGDGPERESLFALKRELGLENHIRFLGERHDVNELLADADFFVLSSIEEGIPLTVLEAMAAGLPVIATRVGGNAEVVIPGKTGLLVEPRTPHELADAILAVLQDPERSRTMGLAGRNRVEQEFDVKNVTASYESLYLQCLSKRHRLR
jgi:sugar transferase (PEP-CTERM/EpsH1 system associated)